MIQTFKTYLEKLEILYENDDKPRTAAIKDIQDRFNIALSTIYVMRSSDEYFVYIDEAGNHRILRESARCSAAS